MHTWILQAGGHALEAAWWGPSPNEAPTLVLLHEGLGCVALWRDFPEQLQAATGFGVFAYSRLGYGQSDPVPLPRPLDYMEQEARSSLPLVLDAAGIRRAVLVGHSDGASIALLYAGGTEDARVAGLVLIAPHVMVEAVTIASIAAAREAYRTTDLRDKLARYHADVDGAFWGWNQAWLDPGFRDWTITARAGSVTVPMLLVQGDADEYGSLAQLDLIEAGALAVVERVVVPGAGHSPQKTHAGLVTEALLAFTSNIMLVPAHSPQYGS